MESLPSVRIDRGRKAVSSRQRNGWTAPLLCLAPIERIAYFFCFFIVILNLYGCANSKHFVGFNIPLQQAKLINIVPVAQTELISCGYASFSGVALYYNINQASLVEGEIFKNYSTKSLSANDFINIANMLQLKVFAYQGNFEDLQKNIIKGRPILILLKKPPTLYNYPSFDWFIQTFSSLFADSHWVIVVGLISDDNIVIHDPARGFLTVSKKALEEGWEKNISVLIIATNKSP